MSDAGESAEAPDIEELMTMTTKPPSAKKKSRREGCLSLAERSLQRIADAENEHMKTGSNDEGLGAAKPIVLFCEEAVLTENVSASVYASIAIHTLVTKFENGENRMVNLDTEEKKDQAVIDFVAIVEEAEVGEDEATIPDLVDELYKLCVYLLRISNVSRSTEKETTVMKDIFGENPKYQQIFVTWMIVLQRNTSETWDAEEDVKVLEILLYADIKRRTDLANGENEAPPLALELAKFIEVFGAEAKEVTNPFEIFGALMLAGVYIMSAPSGNVLGDFIKRLLEAEKASKNKRHFANGYLGATRGGHHSLERLCRLQALTTVWFTSMIVPSFFMNI
jgi:hypothetical protein